jgi:adenosylcobinamide-GDP ribazoletransferase
MECFSGRENAAAALAAQQRGRYHGCMDNAKPEPEAETTAPAPAPGLLARLTGDIAMMLRFYSRLPVPVFAFEREPHAMPDFSTKAWAVPLAGATIGVIAAGMGLGALALGLSPLIAAILVIATTVFITGCFHEDGLADSADGLWGGMTPERRLEIMKDSRIGSYGAAALGLSLLLRAAGWSELFRLLDGQAAWFVIAIAAASRTLALVPTQGLEPATAHGLGAKAQKPGEKALGIGLFLSLSLLAGVASAHHLLVGLVVTASALVFVLWWITAMARAKIGGYTGDILGASQQLIEITLVLGLVAAAGMTGGIE